MSTRTISLILLLVWAPALQAQDDEVAEGIKGLSQALKEKLTADKIHYIKLLGEKWEKADPKQRKEIHKLAARNMKQREEEVRAATIEALARMGGGKKDKDAETSMKILSAQVKLKTTEKNPTYFGKVLVAIGRLHHPKSISTLTKLLKYKNYDVVASTAEAFAHFKDVDLKYKKEIVKEMLKAYTTIANAARNNTRDNTWQKRLEKVQGSFETSLKALTGQSQKGADQWWQWWNNEGKKARKWS